MDTITVVLLCLAPICMESHAVTLVSNHQTTQSVTAAQRESHAVTLVSNHQTTQSVTAAQRESQVSDNAMAGGNREVLSPGDQEPAHTIMNELMLVSILKQRVDGQENHVTFWVDHALVYMSVSVEFEKGSNCWLLDQNGNRPLALMPTSYRKRWTVHRPTVGPWSLLHKGSGKYNISVEGASSLNLEVSLYRTDLATGIAELVHDTPTAGHQIRTMVDMLGAEVVHDIYNISLLTADGAEVAIDWLRPAGGPSDPQYETTFTWPVQPVYIRVTGKETEGSLFERQTSYIITSIPVDLRVSRESSSDILQPGQPLELRYILTNLGVADDFVLTATVDNDVFTAKVSPAQIQLGHMSSVDGIIIITVKRYSVASSGLLTVSAWSMSKPAVVQTTTTYLTSLSDLSDADPPFCQTLAVLGSCLEDDTESAACRMSLWSVDASVEDSASGLQEIAFANVTKGDHYEISSFLEGVSNEAVLVSFLATCCDALVLLDAVDMAGNSQRCTFFRPSSQPDVVVTSSPAHRTTRRQQTTTGSSLLSRKTSTQLSTKQPEIKFTTTTLKWVTKVSTKSTKSPVTTKSDFVSRGGSRPPTSSVPDSVPAVHIDNRKGGNADNADHSTLKTASIILGSLGGFAGVCLSAVGLVLYCRYLQLRRRRRNSVISNASVNGNAHHNDNVPDLIQTQMPRRAYITPL